MRTLSLTVLLSFDLFLIALSYLLAHLLVHDHTFSPFNLYAFSAMTLLIIFLLHYEGIYKQHFDFWRETKQIIKACWIGFAIIVIANSITQLNINLSIAKLVIFSSVLSIVLPTSKRFLKKILFQKLNWRISVKVIGTRASIRRYRKEFYHNWYLGYRYAPQAASVLYIIAQDHSEAQITTMINHYMHQYKHIFIVPHLSMIDFSQSQTIDYTNLRECAFHLENKLLSKRAQLTKAIFEKILTVIAFPVIFILHLYLKHKIIRDSEGGVFFKQKRLGKHHKLFSCYKYRTMYTDGDEILQQYLSQNPQEITHYARYHKYTNDPRITPVGQFLRKTSLDELPQFFNVLRGDMSLIGPRPYMPIEESAMSVSDLKMISQVKPGITGLWQVSGRNELSFKERVDLDVWYVQNWSLWLDFVILLKTFKVVLSKVGAK